MRRPLGRGARPAIALVSLLALVVSAGSPPGDLVGQRSDPAFPGASARSAMTEAPTTATASTPPMQRASEAASSAPPTVYSRTSWINSAVLDIDGKVYVHDACGGTIDNRIYDYRCAGSNNLFLLGHAGGVFRGLNAAYHSGALKVGTTLLYSDPSSQVQRYRVAEIRHVWNADWASWGDWASGDLSQPGITLMTCDGATSSYRILARLYRG